MRFDWCRVRALALGLGKSDGGRLNTPYHVACNQFGHAALGAIAAQVAHFVALDVHLAVGVGMASAAWSAVAGFLVWGALWEGWQFARGPRQRALARDGVVDAVFNLAGALIWLLGISLAELVPPGFFALTFLVSLLALGGLILLAVARI